MKIDWGKVGIGILILLNIFWGYKYFEQKKINSPSAPVIQQSGDQIPEKEKVTRVIDGDTVDVAGVRVRLWGINATEYPEGCLSETAKKRLEELVLNKQVSIVDKGKDKFGRILALVYVDKLLINQTMISEGMAVYDEETNASDPELQAMEKAGLKAADTKKGVWSSKCSQPNPKCVIKGNYRQTDGAKIYSLPDCYNYDRIIVNPVGGDKWFCSEAEATRAGFKRSLDCPGYK